MKRNTKQQPRKLSPFERETERRRREMLRVIGGGVNHHNNIPMKRLKVLIAEGVGPVVARGKDGKPVVIRRGYSNRNFFRDMARDMHRPRGAA